MKAYEQWKDDRAVQLDDRLSWCIRTSLPYYGRLQFRYLARHGAGDLGLRVIPGQRPTHCPSSYGPHIYSRVRISRGGIAALLRHQTVDSAKLSHAESYDAPTATATVATVAVTGRWSRGGPPPSGEHAQPVGRGWAECAGKGARHLPYQDNVSPEHTHTQQQGTLWLPV